jgi:hypothetical protein
LRPFLSDLLVKRWSDVEHNCQLPKSRHE